MSKRLPPLLLAGFSFSQVILAQQPSSDPAVLADQVLEIFNQRCVECHGLKVKKPSGIGFIDDLALLAKSEFVSVRAPQTSELYTRVQTGDMPRRTQAEKEAGLQKAVPLSLGQVSTILDWINAGAPVPKSGGTIADLEKKDRQFLLLEEGSNAPAPTRPTAPESSPTVAAAAAAPAPAPSQPAPAKADAGAVRKLVSFQDELTAALSDLQTVPREEQADTRYISLASLHNYRLMNDDGLENARRGVRKLLNSLSTGPRVLRLVEVGPEKTLFRVRLRDLGWDSALWDKLAAAYPYAIDTGVSAALGATCHTSAPILRADWLAAVGGRPPFYHDLLRLPGNQRELERKLGVDLEGNLKAGEALRTGLAQSRISNANRVLERHELGSRTGYYWVSYDFRSSSERGNISKFPLGPERAQLLGGGTAFRHAGGEFVFSLPN
ncbi:MAG: hypothetical protein EBS01_05315, partial [Verrucomicrobia bacterium]|nr:hypothetical protein [Verrucomicrobiota bacterium]